MTLENIELKRAWLKDQGKAVEDRYEAANAEVYRLQGARGAIKNDILSGIDSVVSLWKRRHADGEVEKEVLDIAVKVCEQCAGSARNILLAAEHGCLSKQGEADAYKRQLDDIEKQFYAEGEKAKAIVQAAENKDPTAGHVEGTHPGDSIAQQRRAEEKAKAKGSRKKKI